MVGLNETLLSIPEAAKYVSKRVKGRQGGRKLNVATVYRWTDRGIRGIRLECTQVGGTRATSVEALERFFARLAGNEPAPARATPASKKRAVAAAERLLDKAGI